MSADITYTTGDGSASYSLQGRGESHLYAQTALEIRGHSWAYSLGAQGLSGVASKAVEATMDVTADGWQGRRELTRLLDSAAADMHDGTPGTLAVGEWQQRAYIGKSRMSIVSPALDAMQLTVVLLDGAWTRPASMSIMPQTGATGGIDLGSLDLPIDLGSETRDVAVSNNGSLPAPLGITWWGPVSDPYLVIDGNTYKVGCTVPTGGRLTVDPRAMSVIMTDAEGNRTDEYARADRGTGLGGGDYIFQPLASGTHEASMQTGLGVDLTVFETRVELPPYMPEAGYPDRYPVSATASRPDLGVVPFQGAVALPSTAVVTYNNGDTGTEPVSWNSAPDTTIVGMHTITGTVMGLLVSCSYTVPDDILQGYAPRHDTWWGGEYVTVTDNGDGTHTVTSTTGDKQIVAQRWSYDGPLVPAGEYELDMPYSKASSIETIQMDCVLRDETGSIYETINPQWQPVAGAAGVITLHASIPKASTIEANVRIYTAAGLAITLAAPSLELGGGHRG